jgi:site-specific DNA recombinase
VDTAVTAVTAVTAATRPELAEAEAEIRRLTAAADRTMLRDIAGPEAEKRWAEAPITRRRAILEALGLRVVILPTGRRGPGFDPESVEIEWKDQQ